jgi:hypothetical protein
MVTNCDAPVRTKVRVPWRRSNWVIKVPHNEAGIQANFDEYRRFKSNKHNKEKYGSEITYARCRMLKGMFLVMEYVVDTPYDSKPDWSDFIDCRQVGLNRRNEYVAYDFGG